MINKLLALMGIRMMKEDIPLQLHKRLSHLPQLQGVSKGEDGITVWLNDDLPDEKKDEIPKKFGGMPVNVRKGKQWRSLSEK